MIEYFDLAATTPYGESCIQVGHENYRQLARLEARAYIDQQIRHFPPPESCSLRIRSNPHDFGTYLTVAVYYDTEIPESCDYAMSAENGFEEWDKVSKDWLEKQGYPFEGAK